MQAASQEGCGKGSPEALVTDEAEVPFEIHSPTHLCPRPASGAVAVGRGAPGTESGWLDGRPGLPSKSSQPIKHLMFSVPQMLHVGAAYVSFKFYLQYLINHPLNTSQLMHMAVVFS